MGVHASLPVAHRSQSFSGLVAPPANLQAMPTTAIGIGPVSMEPSRATPLVIGSRAGPPALFITMILIRTLQIPWGQKKKREI